MCMRISKYALLKTETLKIKKRKREGIIYKQLIMAYSQQQQNNDNGMVLPRMIAWCVT